MRTGGVVGAILWLWMSTAIAAPNFVIMMTDDQRFDAMSCAGNTIVKTPNMDRLAREGVRFKNMFVTNALCAPSRATLLSGLYSHKTGVVDNRNRPIPASVALLPDLLRGAGYDVGFAGKSHTQGSLRDRTWDFYFGFKGQGNYLKPVIAEGVTGKDLPREGYMDDVTTGRAIEWLKTRKQSKPFCLFLFFKAPHRSWTRAPRHAGLYKDLTVPTPATFNYDEEANPDNKPQAFLRADNRVGDYPDVATLDGFVKDYYATVTAVDENIGRVLDALTESKQLDETVVLHTSDNGFFHGEWKRFDKRFMHEPSIRVPMLVRYPKLAKAGATPDSMALNVDIAPTVLDLAGVKPPISMQGRSFAPLLAGETPATWRKDWLYAYYEYPDAHKVRPHRGVRTDRYKLIHYYMDPEEYELYDLASDPGERNNLHGKPESKALFDQLAGRLAELRRETGEDKYTPPHP